MSDTLAADIPTRVAVLEQIARTTLSALERLENKMDHRFDLMERRFDQIERRFLQVDARFETVNNRMDSQFRWLLGTIFALAGLMVTGFAALLGVMAHGFHWL